MTAVTVSTQMERTFKIGATCLPDPVPGAALQDAVRILAQQYPQFRHTQVFEEDATVDSEGRLVYELILPEPKVKG